MAQSKGSETALLNDFYETKQPWYDLLRLIKESMGNRKLNQVPYLQLNPDNSISFFLTNQKHTYINEEGTEAVCQNSACHNPCCQSQQLISLVGDEGVVSVLKTLVARSNYPILGEGEQLIQRIDHPQADGTEVQIKVNLSPESFDSLLKQTSAYSGYFSNETSVLKLSKAFSLKPGYIRLFPVLPMADNTCMIRESGCQLVEMPAVQLMHLLPAYEHKDCDEHFHWTPEGLPIDSETITKATNELLLNEKDKLLDEGLFPESSEGTELMKNPNAQLQRSIGLRLCDMEESDIDFYAIYGNLTKEELKHCQSFEVSTRSYLEALYKVSVNAYTETAADNSLQANEEMLDRISVLKTMILSQTKPVKDSSRIFLFPIKPINETDSEVNIDSRYSALVFMQLLPLTSAYQSMDEYARIYSAGQVFKNEFGVDEEQVHKAVGNVLVEKGLMAKRDTKHLGTQTPIVIKNPSSSEHCFKVDEFKDRAADVYGCWDFSPDELASHTLEISALSLLHALLDVVKQENPQKASKLQSLIDQEVASRLSLPKPKGPSALQKVGFFSTSSTKMHPKEEAQPEPGGAKINKH
jgi:hypothetical protein